MHPVRTAQRAVTIPVEFLASIARHQTLLKEFIKKEIRSRFIGSLAGKLWLVITPLSQIVIFYFVFGVILKMRLSAELAGTQNFVAFLLAGLLPWIAFSEAVLRGTGIILSNAEIIKKVVMPVELLPFVEVTTSFILGYIGFALYLVYLAFKGYADITWLMLPLVIALLFLFTAGLITFLSAITVFFRDTQQLMNLVIQAWFYLTPIIYPVYMIPARYADWIKINPMYPFITLFQEILLKHQVSWLLLATSSGLAIVSFAGGSLFFYKLKHSFSDVL